MDELRPRSAHGARSWGTDLWLEDPQKNCMFTHLVVLDVEEFTAVASVRIGMAGRFSLMMLAPNIPRSGRPNFVHATDAAVFLRLVVTHKAGSTCTPEMSVVRGCLV